jgi:NADH-quinone oxidoreductase subunit J
MELVVFILASAMIFGGAIGVVVRSHPVHCALSLILTLFGIAVLFIAQNAQFLAAVQVIVYAGAIVVLFLFVIMLLGVDQSEDLRIEPFKIQRPLAAVVGVGIVGLIITAAITSRKAFTPKPVPSTGVAAVDQSTHDENIRQLARDLFSNHVFAFELTSVLLVIAVVGTVLLARKPDRAAAAVPGPAAAVAEARKASV